MRKEKGILDERERSNLKSVNRFLYLLNFQDHFWVSRAKFCRSTSSVIVRLDHVFDKVAKP